MTEFSPSIRQTEILSMLAEDGFVSTEDMVSYFEVTPQTIRRDLNELKTHDLITRFHGGAGLVRRSDNRPYEDRLNSRVDAKEKIAKRVASLIPDNASLFLNTGTTIEVIAKKLLAHNGLKVFTNNIHIAETLNANESFRTLVPAGQIRHPDGAITGLATIEAVEQLFMEYGIVGTNSIDEEGVLWDYNQFEVSIARATIKNSEQSILVADQYKFGRRAMHRIGHISEFDIVVTDVHNNEEINGLLSNCGAEIVFPNS